MLLPLAALHVLIMSSLADVPPCVVEWSQWSACSVTCGRGVRQRSKQCREGYRPPVENQGTEEESCSAPQACLKDVIVRSLQARILANVTLRNHVTMTAMVYSETECGLLCARDPSCRSFNLCGDISNLLCELNNATSEGFENDLYWTVTCSYCSTISRTIA